MPLLLLGAAPPTAETRTFTVSRDRESAQLRVIAPELSEGAIPAPGVSPSGELELVLGAAGDDRLTAAIAPRGPVALTVHYDAATRSATLDVGTSLGLPSIEVGGALAVRLSGEEAKRLDAGSWSAGAIRVSGGQRADHIHFRGTVRSTGDVEIATAADLSLTELELRAAGDFRVDTPGEITIRDSAATPFVARSGGDLLLRGLERIDIVALGHPGSALVSGADLRLGSSRPVRGDIHYLAGGQFEIAHADGGRGDLTSPFDPIILAGGDVMLGNFTGASLHVLAGGSATLGQVEITGTDTGPNSINPGNATPFNGVETLADLAAFVLSNGGAGAIDGSATPTLDVRAGVDWTTFAGGAPANQVIPAAAVVPAFGAATSADITVLDVTISVPAGMVFLSNQYRPNALPGDVSAGHIAVGTTTAATDGGSILLDSRGNVSTGSLDTRAEVLGMGVTAGSGGPVTVLAPSGGFATSGDVTTFALIPGNNSGSVGDGGAVTIATALGATLNAGAGRVETFAFANADGNAGDGGDIGVSAASFAASRLHAHSFAGSNGTAGSGGAVLVDAMNGAVEIVDPSPFLLSSIQTFAQDPANSAGNGGVVSVSATDGITISQGVDTRSPGVGSQAGAISLVSTSGDVTAGDLRAIAANTSTPGTPGDVTVQALAGGVVTGDVETLCNAFVIDNPSQNAGAIAIEALAGDVATGALRAFSEARGQLGSAGAGGAISLSAPAGSIATNGDVLSRSLSALNNGDSALAQDGGLVSFAAGVSIDIAGLVNSSSEAQTSGGVGGTAANGGPVQVEATAGSITIGGDVVSRASGNDGAGDGGAIVLEAAIGIQVGAGTGTVDSSADSNDGSAGSGGAISILTGSGDLALSLVDSSARNTFGVGPAGSGGAIEVVTGDGAISFSGGFFVAVDSSASTADTGGPAGDVHLSATQGIVLSQPLQAWGFGTLVDGGDVHLSTTQGDIVVADLLASAINNNDAAGTGGNIVAHAPGGAVTAGEVSSYARSSFIHNTVEDGGDIELHAGNGNVATGPLRSYVEARGEFGHTGRAGRIEVTATGGSITVTGEVRADAFSQDNNTNSGDVGDSQGLAFSATGDITVLGPVTSFSRSSRFDGLPTPTGNAGHAGPVTLSGQNIALESIDARSIAAGTIGNGGTVDIDAGQFFRATGTLFASAATIDTTGLVGSGATTIRHGGNGITPFVVGDATTNGTAGALTTAEATITPLASFLFDHFESPNITILTAAETVVDLDIKPGSCPNSFNRKSKGKLPVALVGTPDFDVALVDPSTLTIAREDGVGGAVSPLRSHVEDVATPFPDEGCGCHAAGGDGSADLTLKFASQEVVTELSLDDFSRGNLVPLVVSGTLLDGTPFTASDCVRIVR